MPIIVKKRGRPSKLTAKLIEKIYFLLQKGLTELEVCQIVDINQDTLNVWKSSPYFSEALKRCKEDVDERVEQSLLRRALGYEFEEEHYSEKAHSSITVTKTMHPDVTACIFWLKNRRRDQWRDVQDHKHSGSVAFSLLQLVRLANTNGAIPNFAGTSPAHN